MANVLDLEKQQQILALGRLGWTLRRIEQETGIRRETASHYLKQAPDRGRIACEFRRVATLLLGLGTLKRRLFDLYAC